MAHLCIYPEMADPLGRTMNDILEEAFEEKSIRVQIMKGKVVDILAINNLDIPDNRPLYLSIKMYVSQ